MTSITGRPAYSGRSWTEIQTIADRLRVTLGVDGEDRLPMIRVFERLDRFQIPAISGEIGPVGLWYEVQEDDSLMRRLRLEAFADFDLTKRRLVAHLRGDVYASVERNEGGRSFFNLAHEIGHLVLHPRELRDRAVAGVGNAFAREVHSNHPRYQDTEWQANAFAGCFLAPASRIFGVDLADPSRLTRFGLSIDAARVRASVITDHFPDRRLAIER